MDAALDALEEKIRLTADLAKRLRAENIELRQRIAALEADNKRLADKVSTVSERLETLIRQLPE
jgi:cell division protein ZapB